MVRPDLEGLRLEEMLEVFGRQVDGQELSVEGGVAPLGVRELLTVEGQRRRLPVEALLQHCPNGDVAGVGREEQLCVWSWEGEESGVCQGLLSAPEGGLGVGVPAEELRLALEEFVQGGELGGDAGQEPVVERHQSQELLKAPDSGGFWKPLNGLNLLPERREMAWPRNSTSDAPKIHLSSWAMRPFSLSLSRMILEVLEVLLPRVGEHEDVVHVTHAEGQVTEDVIHEALKGGPSIFEAKAGVVECVRNDGRLWYVLGMHWDLKVALHQVQFAEDGGPVQERGNISDVGQWIVVGLGDVIEAPVITAGPDGAVLLNHYMQGRGPRTRGLLTEPLLLHFLETPFCCGQSVGGEASEPFVDGRPSGFDVVLHRVLGRSPRGP